MEPVRKENVASGTDIVLRHERHMNALPACHAHETCTSPDFIDGFAVNVTQTSHTCDSLLSSLYSTGKKQNKGNLTVDVTAQLGEQQAECHQSAPTGQDKAFLPLAAPPAPLARRYGSWAP